MWKAAPPSGGESAQMRPPCASTMERQIDRPMPMPSALVVKNALNSRSASSGAMPLPASRTVTCTWRDSASAVLTQSLRGRPAPSIACTAFISRLISTC
ncbi:hypothetical protein D3C85_1168050 [compost metagenome]